MTARGLKSVTVGARVQFTGYYLRATGQVTGDEGGKRWTVRARPGGAAQSMKRTTTSIAR